MNTSRFFTLLLGAGMTVSLLGGCMGTDGRVVESGEAQRASLVNGFTFLRQMEATVGRPMRTPQVRDCLRDGFNVPQDATRMTAGLMAAVGNDVPDGPLTEAGMSALTRIAGCFCEPVSQFGLNNRVGTLFEGLNYTTVPSAEVLTAFLLRVAQGFTAVPETQLREPAAAAATTLATMTNARAAYATACVLGATSIALFER